MRQIRAMLHGRASTLFLRIFTAQSMAMPSPDQADRPVEASFSSFSCRDSRRARASKSSSSAFRRQRMLSQNLEDIFRLLLARHRRIVDEVFHIAVEDRERRPQFVGNIGDEFAPHFLELLAAARCRGRSRPRRAAPPAVAHRHGMDRKMPRRLGRTSCVTSRACGSPVLSAAATISSKSPSRAKCAGSVWPSGSLLADRRAGETTD